MRMKGNPKAADPSRQRPNDLSLTGGKSSRIGGAKALLEFDGEPLIVHIVRALDWLRHGC